MLVSCLLLTETAPAPKIVGFPYKAKWCLLSLQTGPLKLAFYEVWLVITDVENAGGFFFSCHVDISQFYSVLVRWLFNETLPSGSFRGV